MITKDLLTAEFVGELGKQAITELQQHKHIDYKISYASWSFGMSGWGLIFYFVRTDGEKQRVKLEWPEDMLLTDTYVAVDRPANLLGKAMPQERKVNLRIMYLIWMAYQYLKTLPEEQLFQSFDRFTHRPEIGIWVHYDGEITKEFK